MKPISYCGLCGGDKDSDESPGIDDPDYLLKLLWGGVAVSSAGAGELLTNVGFDLSPDGKLAAFYHRGAGKEYYCAGVDSGGRAREYEAAARSANAGWPVHFTPDGLGALYPFREKDAGNLWRQPLDGSPGKQVTNFRGELLRDFHWSFDGRKLAMLRGHSESNVVVIRDGKQ